MIKILLPVDGSEPALDAVRHALALVREGLQARFVLANVQEPATLYEMVVAHDAEVLEQVSEGAGAHLLEPAEALLREACVEWEREIAHGDPANMLIAIAERYECDTIVVGARGAGAARGAPFGSVTHGLLDHSTLPVTVVRQREPQPSAEAEPDSELED